MHTCRTRARVSRESSQPVPGSVGAHVGWAAFLQNIRHLTCDANQPVADYLAALVGGTVLPKIRHLKCFVKVESKDT